MKFTGVNNTKRDGWRAARKRESWARFNFYFKYAWPTRENYAQWKSTLIEGRKFLPNVRAQWNSFSLTCPIRHNDQLIDNCTKTKFSWLSKGLKVCNESCFILDGYCRKHVSILNPENQQENCFRIGFCWPGVVACATDETKFCETAPKSLFWVPSCVPGFECAPWLVS